MKIGKKQILSGAIALLLALSTQIVEASAGVVFYSSDKKGNTYLLLGLDRRTDTTTGTKGYWSDFGGSDEPGELPSETAAREGAEETALFFDSDPITQAAGKQKWFQIKKTRTYKKILAAIPKGGTHHTGKGYPVYFVWWGDLGSTFDPRNAPQQFAHHLKIVGSGHLKENLAIAWFPVGQVVAAVQNNTFLNGFPVGKRLAKKIKNLVTKGILL